jgi:hypothetical protein
MANLKTIRESQSVEADINMTCRDWPRFESAWEGWTWRIARGPEKGMPLPNHQGVYLFKSHPAFVEYGIPETTILYRVVGDDVVDIISIKVSGS